MASCRFPALHSALPKSLDFKQLEQAFYYCELECSGSASRLSAVGEQRGMEFDTTLHILVFASAVSILILSKKEIILKLVHLKEPLSADLFLSSLSGL